jgi:hypothetical protein
MAVFTTFVGSNDSVALLIISGNFFMFVKLKSAIVFVLLK